MRAGPSVLGAYPYWFYLPAAIVFGVIFVVPTVLAFYYSLTRWTLFDAEFIGLDNFALFFREPALTQRPAQHDRLRRRHERAQGHPRAAAGGAADLEDPTRGTSSGR